MTREDKDLLLKDLCARLPYVDKVNAYCKRVGIHIKGYTDFIKIMNNYDNN